LSLKTTLPILSIVKSKKTNKSHQIINIMHEVPLSQTAKLKQQACLTI